MNGRCGHEWPTEWWVFWEMMPNNNNLMDRIELIDIGGKRLGLYDDHFVIQFRSFLHYLTQEVNLNWEKRTQRSRVWVTCPASNERVTWCVHDWVTVTDGVWLSVRENSVWMSVNNGTVNTQLPRNRKTIVKNIIIKYNTGVITGSYTVKYNTIRWY